MSEDFCVIIQGLIDLNNALRERVEKLELTQRQDHQALDRAITQVYHLELRVKEIDRPTPAMRRLPLESEN